MEIGRPVTVAALLATWLVGCGKETGPSGVRERPLAAAASASSPAVLGGDAPEAVPASEPSPPAAVSLRPISAAALRAELRRSGSKATLVNAWASWCGPCRREVPMLQALSSNLKPLGVEVVLISVDAAADQPKAVSFLKDNGITLKSYIVHGSVGELKAGLNPRWPGMLPASFLFDAQANLVHFWGGEAFEHEIVPVVESFLAGRPIEAETRFGLAPGKVDP
jgi:thiol-disulfide isomerase/thioredoxin